jgi:hypothetical protein
MEAVRANTVDCARLDVQELLIHVVPLLRRPYSLHTWNTILSIGCGLADRSCNILSDTAAEIVGTLRDYPSVRVEISLAHTEGKYVGTGVVLTG